MATNRVGNPSVGWSAVALGLTAPAIAIVQPPGVAVSAEPVRAASSGLVPEFAAEADPGPEAAGSDRAEAELTSQPMLSIKTLVRMSVPELDQLYQQASAGAIPVGKTRGRVILYPGTRLASPASKVGRAAWQGKVFAEDQASAVNRFFGLKVIRANVSYGPSWLDGKTSIILDYQSTSKLYAPYRDEIREVAPGLYLGRMYERTQPQPTLKLYFALESTSSPAAH